MSDGEEGYKPSFSGGLGFRGAAVNEGSDEEDPRPALGGGIGFRPPMAFAQSATTQDEDDDEPPAKKMKFMKSMAGGTEQPRHASTPNKPGSGGSSFAARMMAKMGYKEGTGLGADGKGRLAPIDAQLRPQGAGLGAVREKTKQAKEEEKRAAAFRGETVEDSSEEERRLKKEAKKKRQQQALSGIGSSQRKSRTKYRTAAEIETESAGLEVPNVLKSLIDVTGKDTQFTTSTPGVMVPQETEAGKIAKRARRDLEAFAEEWSNLKEQKTYTDLESEQIVTDIDSQLDDARHIQEVVQTVDDLQILSLQAGTMEVAEDQWESITTKLETLEVRFQNELDRFGMPEVAVAAIHPLFKLSMLNWEPLKQPELLVDYISRLQHILGAIASKSSSDTITLRSKEYVPIRPNKKSTSHYETMVYTLWLPPVRSAITNDWEVEKPEPVEKLLGSWKSLLPEFVLNHILLQLLVPRLVTGVVNWKPGRSSTKSRGRISAPPHQWLFPWLELLPASHLDPDAHDSLAAELRRKVRSLLGSHDVSTGSPTWLLPLRSPFLPEPVFAKLTTNYLLPRLATYTDATFVVDPTQQAFDVFDNVLSFTSLYKAETFAELLIAGFFDKFHATLHAWLIAKPDYGEVREWYIWWMAQIPPTLRKIPSITRQWDAAIEMINAALSLGPQVQTRLPRIRSFLAETDRRSKRDRRERRHEQKTTEEKYDKIGARPQEDQELTFRDVLEEYCSDLGLLFMPMREAHATNGAPLFRITANSNGKGGLVCYSYGDMLYRRFKTAEPDASANGDVWKPVDWERELMSMAGG